MFKIFFVVGFFCASVFAEVTPEDVKDMINLMEKTAAELKSEYEETMRENPEEIIKKVHEEIQSRPTADQDCLEKTAKDAISAIALSADECLNGYSLSCKSLAVNLQSNIISQEELEHTKHMLSKDGSFFPQLKNSIDSMENSIERIKDNFISKIKEC